MTHVSLMEALTPPASKTDHGSLVVPTGWEQGKGAYGGLVLGSLVRAVELAEPDSHRLVRAVSGEIPAPVEPGAARITVVPLRRGNAVSTVRAELIQRGSDGDEVRAHVVAVTATARPNMPSWQNFNRPQAPDWQSVPVIAVQPPLGPPFGQHFEFRVVDGLPFSGTGPRCLGYVRPLRPGNALTAAAITAIADAWWPAILPAIKAPRPTATLTFALNIINTLDGLDPAIPLLHFGEAAVSKDGYCAETRYLWGHDGRLVSINHQTFVIIK
jgi:hypothetical protein